MSPVTINILKINPNLNIGALPAKVNDFEIIEQIPAGFAQHRVLRSQYALEVTLHNIIKDYPFLQASPQDADIIFVPIYTFCLAWRKPYIYDVGAIVESIHTLLDQLTRYAAAGHKVLIPYSDVMWPDSRCFMHHFKFHKNFFFVAYERADPNDNVIVVPYCTHIKANPIAYPIPCDQNRNHIICYAGRPRKEISRFESIESYYTENHDPNKWISLNSIENYNNIDSMYLNSFFSLQPHGDRKTRRGFYHSLLLGCIPVIFTNTADAYREVFDKVVPIEEIAVIIDTESRDPIRKLIEQLPTWKRRIANVEKIKNLLLYEDGELGIVKNIIEKIESLISARSGSNH